ncbi:hypothetical protein PCASD_08635 [Puccinia coronata f. sp. avenae]|uniref:DNA 3'-5' helicase n=1 Tax=Puccinia coronata f. sp. avenae TaxID=200324 RepID=A0A2N5V7D3_9BASI|nr:hypothetical protein PCASD_08635 [Puccinia coronata f. sp. avenae]
MSTLPTPAQIVPSDKGLEHMIIDGAAEQLSGSKQQISLPKKILALSRDKLKDHIREMANAGNGFGKTQIAEIYSMLFKPYQKAVIVVLNPLDTLGDNQVEEKKSVGLDNKTIQLINLTKDTLTKNVATQIIQGDFAFIYVSPEVFLNRELFKGIYFNPTFQSHLVSVVVDEAHMIYIYGKLGSRLMARNGAPLLLMSATCPPVAIAGILDSLRMPLPQAHFVWAELTRPEIRILRIPMKNSLASCNDLLQLYSPEEPSNNAIAPTLIYSCTINHTLQVLKVIHEARGIPKGEDEAKSSFAR